VPIIAVVVDFPTEPVTPMMNGFLNRRTTRAQNTT